MASRKYLKVRLELENGFTKDVGKVKQENLKEYLKAFQEGRARDCIHAFLWRVAGFGNSGG